MYRIRYRDDDHGLVVAATVDSDSLAVAYGVLDEWQAIEDSAFLEQRTNNGLWEGI